MKKIILVLGVLAALAVIGNALNIGGKVAKALPVQEPKLAIGSEKPVEVAEFTVQLRPAFAESR